MINLKKKFFKYVSLNILSMLGISFYILVDTYFIANGCGSDGLASLNIAIPMYGFIFGIAMMIGVGFGTRFKIAFDDYNAKCSIFTKGVFFVILISVPFVILGLFFSKNLSYILGARGNVLVLTDIYLKTIMAFTPVFMINNLLNCFIRNDNNPSIAMKAVVISSFANIVLDYIFVFPLDMGMFGAALATVVSPIVGISILSLHFIKKKNTFKLIKTKIRLGEFFYLSSLGVSTLINDISSSVVIIVFNLILLQYSSKIGVAAYGVIANIALVVIAVFNGIGQGIQPLISESYAKKREDDIIYLLRLAIGLGIISSVLIYIILYLNSHYFTNLFNPQNDDMLLNMSVEGISIYFLGTIFASINLITITSMQAMEKPRISFIISILRGIIIIVPLAIIMSNMFLIKGMWFSYVITEFLVAILSLIFMYRYVKL